MACARRLRCTSLSLHILSFLYLLSASYCQSTTIINAPFVAEPFVDAILCCSGQTDFDANFASFTNAAARLAPFWFGAIRPDLNFLTARVGFSDQNIYVEVTCVDRNQTENASVPLIFSDAIEILFCTTTSTDGTLDPTCFSIGVTRGVDTFVQQGGAAGFVNTTLFPFTTATKAFSGGKSWQATFRLSFSLLHIRLPTAGAIWKFAVINYDQDDPSLSTPSQLIKWPSVNVDRLNSLSWGSMRFGRLRWQAPAAPLNPVEYQIRDKVNGQTVSVVGVGGQTGRVCSFSADMWSVWGDWAFPSSSTGTVANQGDGDNWPCFAMLLFSFPLTALPVGKVVVNATVSIQTYSSQSKNTTMDTTLQFLTTSFWDSATNVTWNNAPRPFENVGSGLVPALIESVPLPRTAFLSVDAAVNRAYSSGAASLFLIAFSADPFYNSVKYFTLTTPDANAAARPTLLVTLADSANAPGAECNYWSDPEQPSKTRGGNPSTTPNVICPNAPQPTLPPATSASPLPTPPNSESMTQPLTTDPTTTNSESTTSPVTTTPTPTLSTLPQKTTTPHPPHKRPKWVIPAIVIIVLAIVVISIVILAIYYYVSKCRSEPYVIDLNDLYSSPTITVASSSH